MFCNIFLLPIPHSSINEEYNIDHIKLIIFIKNIFHQICRLCLVPEKYYEEKKSAEENSFLILVSL